MGSFTPRSSTSCPRAVFRSRPVRERPAVEELVCARGADAVFGGRQVGNTGPPWAVVAKAFVSCGGDPLAALALSNSGARRLRACTTLRPPRRSLVRPARRTVPRPLSHRAVPTALPDSYAYTRNIRTRPESFGGRRQEIINIVLYIHAQCG